MTRFSLRCQSDQQAGLQNELFQLNQPPPSSSPSLPITVSNHNIWYQACAPGRSFRVSPGERANMSAKKGVKRCWRKSTTGKAYPLHTANPELITTPQMGS